MGILIFSKKQGGFFPLLLSPPPRPHPPPPPRVCGERRESRRLRPAENLGKKPAMPGPGERRAEPGRDAGDGAAAGQAGGAKGRKMGSGSQITGGSQTIGNLATEQNSAVPPPRARCVSGAGALVDASVAGLAPQHTREPRVRHSHPGEPRKILSQLVSGLACLPNIPLVKDCHLPLRQSPQRFRSVGFASRKLCYRQVALRRCPLQAVVSAPVAIRPGLPQGQACAGGLGCPAHPLPPPLFSRSSQPRRTLPAPGSALEPLCAGRVRGEVPQPDARGAGQGSSPGAGPRAAGADTLLRSPRDAARSRSGERAQKRHVGGAGWQRRRSPGPSSSLGGRDSGWAAGRPLRGSVLFKSGKAHPTEFPSIPFPPSPSGERETLPLYSLRPHPPEPTAGIPALPFPPCPGTAVPGPASPALGSGPGSAGGGSVAQRRAAAAASSAGVRGGAEQGDGPGGGVGGSAVPGGPGRERRESGRRLSRLSLACCRRRATCAAITRCLSMMRMHFSQVQSLKRQ